MEIYLIIGTCIIAFLAGFIICMAFTFHYPKGTIIIEENEDKTRDCIRFILDLELEDMKKYKSITFDVIDQTSKKEQSV